MHHPIPPHQNAVIAGRSASCPIGLVGWDAHPTRYTLGLKHPDIVVDEHLKTLVTSPLARSLSFERPDALLPLIDALRTEHGDRLPVLRFGLVRGERLSEAVGTRPPAGTRPLTQTEPTGTDPEASVLYLLVEVGEHGLRTRVDATAPPTARTLIVR